MNSNTSSLNTSPNQNLALDRPQLKQNTHVNTPDSHTKASIQSNHLNILYRALPQLMNPFKEYPHWVAYGYSFNNQSQNKPTHHQIKVTRTTLHYNKQTTAKSHQYTVIFDTQQVKKGTTLLPQPEAATFFDHLSSLIKSNQKVKRTPFIEVKKQ